MRLIASMLALCLVAGAAAAQAWKEHPYPDQGFSVAFPNEPRIETTTYQALDGRSVPARVYSVTQPNAEFKMTIADVPNPTNTDHAVVDQAVKALARGSEIKLDMPARVRAVYGRQLTLSEATAAIRSWRCSITRASSISSRARPWPAPLATAGRKPCASSNRSTSSIRRCGGRRRGSARADQRYRNLGPAERSNIQRAQANSRSSS